MATPQFKLKIPPEVAKFVQKDAPKPLKMMAARGLAPMKPDVLLTVLFMLKNDGDGEIAEAAEKSLLGQPKNVLIGMLKQPMHHKLLHFFAEQKIADEDVLEVILLNKYTGDETLLFLAPQVNEKLLTIISNNQTRLLGNKDIAEALRKNPNAPKSTLDRVISFLRMNGIILEGVKEELTQAEIKAIAEEPDDLILQSIYEEDDDDDLENLSTLIFNEEEDIKADDVNLIKKLSTMPMGEKIKLAIKGGKEVRSTLIKDPNKLICTSVVKNPRVKVMEVIAFAQMRSVNDEVLRLISVNPEWMKNYKVKQALVNNPKTPMPVTMQYMKHLRTNDLGMLAKNKGVPQAVQKAAKALWQKKR